MRAPLGALVAAVVLVAAGCGGGSASDPGGAEADAGPVELVERMREGGLVLYLRHTHTDRSKEDEGVVDLDDCSRQRPLSERGRDEARRLGRAFRELGIPVGDVLSSEYCRTRETADLAFGRYADEPDLTGFPDESDPGHERRVRRTRELLGTPAGTANTVLVAHVKNLQESAGIEIEEGDLAVFEPRGEGRFRYLGRIPVAVWDELVEELA